MATKEEIHLARQLFKCRCILASAKAFQDLFWDVMKAMHGEQFEAIAPQGRKGDGGNDGYLPAHKHYFQVYAPISPKEKADAAAKKLTEDFEKLRSAWGGKRGTRLLKYSFAYNDKYQGIPKDIGLALEGLRSKHKGITFGHYGCSELETDFLSLPDTAWDSVLGMPLPDPAKIARIDYSILAEVVKHIMTTEVDESETRIDLPPELDEKIKLNELSQTHAVKIQNGAIYSGHVRKFFDANSVFALDELRGHIVGVYETAKTVVRDNPSQDCRAADDVFVLFRQALFPKHRTISAASAVDAVIGYFFEACDVFDPHANKGLPGASPE